MLCEWGWMFQVAADEGVGGAKYESENSWGGIRGCVLRNGRTAEDEEIRKLPVLQEEIHNGVIG